MTKGVEGEPILEKVIDSIMGVLGRLAIAQVQILCWKERWGESATRFLARMGGDREI